MKKKTVFRIVLIVLCVLCTLSVLQVRNVLANHRQNEHDDSTDDSFDEDSPHDLVLPPPPEFKDNELVDTNEFFEEKPDDSIEYSHNLPPQGIKDITPPAFRDMENLYNRMSMGHGLLYNYEPYYIMEGWNYTEKYTPEPGRRNYSDSRYKELQERRDELERMAPELKLQELVERVDEIERLAQELEKRGNAGVTVTF